MKSTELIQYMVTFADIGLMERVDQDSNLEFSA